MSAEKSELGTKVEEAYQQNLADQQQTLCENAVRMTIAGLAEFDGTVSEAVDIIDSLGATDKDDGVMGWPFKRFAMSFPAVVESAAEMVKPTPPVVPKKVKAKAPVNGATKMKARTPGILPKSNGAEKPSGNRTRLKEVAEQILAKCGGRNGMTTGDIMDRTGFGQRQVLNALSKLQDNSLVTKEGERRSTTWGIAAQA